MDDQGRIKEPNLLALLTVLKKSSDPLNKDPVRPLLHQISFSQSDYQLIRTHHPTLLSSLPTAALHALIQHTLKARLDDFSTCLIEDLLDCSSNTFTTSQCRYGLQQLINLARRRRRWVPTADQRLSFVSDEAVSRYFSALVRITPLDQQRSGSFGLTAENLRCVMKALRRSQHPLFWDSSLMEGMWERMVKARSNDNRLETHARFGVRAIIKWIASPTPSSEASSSHTASHPTLSLCLKVYSHLLQWEYITNEDVYRTSLDDPNLQSHHHPIITILGSIINASIRRSSADPLGRDNAKLFKDACEALETLWDVFEHPLPSSTSTLLEHLASRMILTFNEMAKTDHRAPAPLIVSILLRFADLPTVMAYRTDEPGLTLEDILCKNTLNTLLALGRSSLLVHAWLQLVRHINLARLDWPLLRLLRALEELANPLVRGELGQPLNPFRLARLVLSLMDALAEETDSRMRPSRRRALRIILEQPRTQAFDWLAIPPCRFDRDGFELVSEARPELEAENLQALIRLWTSAWMGAREAEESQSPLSLPTLRSITRLAEVVRCEETSEMLKQAVTKFVAHRTPPPIDDGTRYLKIRPARLSHQERTGLIAAHLAIGSELSQRFGAELFESLITDSMVPSVEDMRLLWKLLELMMGEAEAEAFWSTRAVETPGLPWSPVEGSGWTDEQRLRIAGVVLDVCGRGRETQKEGGDVT